MKVKRLKTSPVHPVIPVGRSSESVGPMAAADRVRALPAWMYGDPADVAERRERAELARAERERRRRFGRVSAATERLIRRARIRELVAVAMGRAVS